MLVEKFSKFRAMAGRPSGSALNFASPAKGFCQLSTPVTHCAAQQIGAPCQETHHEQSHSL